MEVVLIVFWIAISFGVGVAAGTRGRGGTAWFLLAIVISPILALLFLLVIPSLKDEQKAQFDDAELLKNIRRGKSRQPSDRP